MLRQLIRNFTSKKKESPASPVSRSDKELKFSESRYRRLFETARDGILILDADSGKIADANPFLISILGYPLNELVGKELWQIGVFKDIVDSKQAFRELQDKGYIRYEDLPLKAKDGKPIDVEFVSNVYMVGAEKVIQCNIRDITERVAIEKLAKIKALELELLSKSEEESKKAMLNVMEDLEEAKKLIEIEKVKDDAMLDSIGEGLIAVDNKRRVMIVNRAAESMLGWKSKDMIGREITGLPLEDEAGNLLPLKKRPTYMALLTGRQTNDIYYFVRKDKTRIPIAIIVTPIRLGGKIIGAVDIFRDITREREIDRAKSEFVSLASHQLRTPLGISKWYLEALNENGFLKNASEKAKDYLNEVYKSNERLLSLVRDLLSVSRIDQGTVKDAPEKIIMADLVKEIVSSMNLIAAKNNIIVNLKMKSRNIPVLFLDSLKLHQVIENLISNAIEYSDPGGKIEIVVEKREMMILISVKDTGIGISPGDQKKLFAKFFRTAKASTRNTDGTGLGLYVVKSYVEGWGGTVTMRSTEGKGSTFTVSLPIFKKKSHSK